MKILLATHNRHKAEELSAMLATLEGITVLTLDDIPTTLPDPVEDGATLEANAYIKAQEIFAETNIPCIADDTGLEVEALDGAPGIYSARYAGTDASYEDNCTKLLEALSGKTNRTARFRTVICYIDASRTLFAEGIATGEILAERQGEQGFGYDPIFQPHDSNKSFAEMNSKEKNMISHRGKALVALQEVLTPYISNRLEHTS